MNSGILGLVIFPYTEISSFTKLVFAYPSPKINTGALGEMKGDRAKRRASALRKYISKRTKESSS